MGFLSRKTKPSPTPVVEETHPIDDELQEMERVVPEQGTERPTAGPVAETGTPSSQAVAAPGREAEEAAPDSSSPSPDDDRNLIPSEEGEGPATRAESPTVDAKVD